MLRSILHTAFHPPRSPVPVFERERCLQRLQQAVDKRLIMLRAGAGFGKTSLMRLFYQKLTQRKIWLSIPDGYFTCEKLLIHLFYGLLEHGDSSWKTKWETTLYSMMMETVSQEQMVMNLIRLMEGVTEDVYIFLDDFHNLRWIERENGLHVLPMIARFITPHVHFVIASREELPFPIHRLRQMGQLLELVEQDLIFEWEELQHFLQINGIDPAEDWLKWLWQKTEGWIAGICLILDCDRDKVAMQNIVISVPPVKSYLTEILGMMPKRTAEFVLETCIFDTISVEVCNAYLGIHDSQRILDELVESRRLTQRYKEDGKHYYRYHNLLKEYFLAQLDSTTIRGYHRRLAQMYCTLGQKEMEVVHWIAAGEDARAMELIQGEIPLKLDSSGLTLLNEWLDHRAVRTTVSDPFVYLYQGWLRSLQGRLGEALTYYCQAEKGLAEVEDWSSWAWVRIQIADLFWWTEQYEKEYQCCQETLRNQMIQQPEFLAGLYNYIGMSAIVLKRSHEGVNYLHMARELAITCGDLDRESWVVIYLAYGSTFIEGNVEEAFALCNYALQNFKKIRNQLGMAITTMTLGYMNLATHELVQAEKALEEAEKLCRELNNIHLIRPVYCVWSMIAIAKGDLRKAEEYLNRIAESLQPPVSAPHFHHAFRAFVCALWHIKRGELVEAEKELVEAGARFDCTGGDQGNVYTQYQLTWILLHLAKGENQTAFDTAQTLQREVSEAGLAMASQEVRFLSAMVQVKMGGSMTAWKQVLPEIRESQYAFLEEKYAGWLPERSELSTSKRGNENEPLRVRFLGKFHMQLGEQTIISYDWKKPKVLDLFKFLLFYHDRWIPLEEIIEQFWRNSDLAKAKQSLYVALYEIRRILEPNLCKGKDSRFIFGKRGTYRLELPKPYWLDTEIFQAGVREGVRFYQEKSVFKARTCLEKTLELYQGDFILENMYDEWTQGVREGFIAQYRELITTLTLIYREQGLPERALPLLRQGLAKNPFDDQIHEFIIRCWIELNHTHEAIRHFREYNQMYLDELGVEMPIKIRTLYRMMVE